jgi:hypothetical protein
LVIVVTKERSMSESGFDLSELTELQQQVLLASASELLQAASSSPRIGGEYDSGPTGIKSAFNDSLLEELAKIPNVSSLGGHIKELVKKSDAPVLIDSIDASGNIVFGGGVLVGGWTALSLFPNGAWNLNGHLHNSGAPSYDLRVIWVVITTDGLLAFVLPITGRVHGAFESGSRNFDWNRSDTNPAIAAAWPKLSAGYRWQWNAAVLNDIGPSPDLLPAITTAGQIITLL